MRLIMFHSVDEQTIIAQCTPRGSGAIALLRISGIDAISIAGAIAQLASGKKLTDLPSHTIHYGNVVDAQKNIIDSVLFMLMRAPRTFTGQNTVEITCHNNQFIIEEIICQAIRAGARLAQEGEFTKRAVLNGKINLVQAEAINELIHAQTQMALKQSLAQLSGSFSSWLAGIETELMKALAFCQASFEFLDEEMEFGTQINSMIAEVRHSIADIKKTFNQQQQIRQGVRIALIGTVNAGKSSLFNALLNQQRAIVNAQAGTTRDSIEAGLYKNGNFWTLVDTAGLRQTQDVIEQEGIRRSFEEAHKADIILLAYDSTRELSQEESAIYTQLQEKYEHKIICVYTKCDTLSFDTSGPKGPSTQDVYTEKLMNNNLDINSYPLHILSANEVRVSKNVPYTKQNIIYVSSKTKNNIGHLEQIIQQKVAALFEDISSPFLLNQRQHNLLLSLENKLLDIETMLNSKHIAYELLSIHLNDAIAHLAELSGKEISEVSMDMVFREFCVGK